MTKADLARLLKKRGFTLSGFGACALVAADPSAPADSRAEALSAMGRIAEYVEPGLQIDEDGGLSYYLMALKHDPHNQWAMLGVVSLYRDDVWGHTDTTEAARCYRAIQALTGRLDPDVAATFGTVQREMAEKGVLRFLE